MTPFGKEVAKALIDRDMTQSDFAKEIGCSPAYISGILTGKKVPAQAFWDHLVGWGMATDRMRAAFAFARGELSVEGLTLPQVERLVNFFDQIAPRACEGPA